MQAALQRKVIYIVSLIVLMLLLYLIGRPSRVVVQSGVAGANVFDRGGVLAQYRASAKLSEAQMGEIDPASSTIKLATFGMRGVAIALLWHQKEELNKRHEWNGVVAIANQIIFLEPHFVSIWEFLGWTLSYNASADFDDYRERYRWVIRGIDFVITGLKKNMHSPQLHKWTGWSVSQKIGIADEAEQYRRLLMDDEAFGERHECKLPSERDNWLLGRRWYHWGEELVLSGESIGGQSDFVYFANSRYNLFNYAKWKRKDGIFGKEAIDAWLWAIDEWKEFSHLELNAAIPVDGSIQWSKKSRSKRARLDTLDTVREQEKKLLAELHGIAPTLRETLCIERWKQLAEVEGQQGSMLPLLETVDTLDAAYMPVEELTMVRKWLDENEPDWKTRLTKERQGLFPQEETANRSIPSMFLDEEEQAVLTKTDGDIEQVRARALERLRLTPKLLSQEIQELDVPREQKRRALAIADELDGHPEQVRLSKLFRDILNYESRFREVAVETSQQADDAHRLRYEARKAYYDGRLADSVNGWIDAMKKWDELLDIEEFQDRAANHDFIRDRIDIVEKFLILLDDSNKIFSDIAEDRVPLHRLMWNRLFQSGEDFSTFVEALNYAKKEYEQALAETDSAKRKEKLETVEKYFSTVSGRLFGLNYREKFMEYAPFFEVRDRILESSAYYIKTLEAQGKPLPEPFEQRTDVELMLKHDPAVNTANEILANTIPLIREGKHEEAQTELDRAVSAWKTILEKYPLIAHDPTNSAYTDIVRLAVQYVDVLRAQEKPMPEDFPLKAFLR
jgi:hypothetical protein